MKAILALLFGLISSSFANRMDDSVVLEFESPDSADVADQQSDDIGSDSSAQSYNGIIIQVRQGANESPTIALGSDMDDYDDVYCLNFAGLFEASSYDTLTNTNAEYTEVDDTRIDLADANCAVIPEGATIFQIVCDDVGAQSATLSLTFTFVQDEQGDYGLEYIINLADYRLSDGATNLVMVQSLDECGDVIDIDAESTEDTEDEEDTPEPTEAGTDSAETTEADDNGIVSEGGRRRLLQSTTDSTDEDEETPEPTETESADEEDTSVETDEESIEEADGISEDDSGEFDAGFARFVVNGQALDVCSNEDQSEVDSRLVYQEDDDELHIVFGRFTCTLVLDPFYGLDESKYDKVYGEPTTTKDNAYSMNIFIASIIGLCAYLW